MNRQPPLGARLDRSHPLSLGLVGYWPLNEPGGLVAVDAVQEARGRGTITGTTVTPGRFAGVSRTLNGTSDKIVTTSINATDGQISGSCSFVAWVNPSSAVNGNALGSPGASSYYASLGPTSTSHFSFAMFDGTHNPQATAAAFYSLNQWYCIAGVRDSGNTLSLYINGVFAVSTADTLTGVNAYTGINIGDTTTFFYAGKIENCRVYNRALTAAEVMRLYVEPYAGLGLPKRRTYRRSTFATGRIPMDLFQSRVG